ncbi:hypothetical protein [uncultured Pseudodesulfovibrio sp.]|uniref:hypothetical protein n=1 Tax=uncultured Pseudodesulfovibrio sp. TaxID=2035858 RepID=UPI0029C976AF|nr:hypothetical protein [uncultured Pseudodesulfovibrio sp.]
MPNVKMPDGKVVQFPEGMSKEDMRRASAKYVTQHSGPKADDGGDWVRGTFQTLGSVLGGGAAAIGGQLGPQAFAPEEVVTVPAGAALGNAMGGQAYDYIRGLMYPETMPSVGESYNRAATDAAVDLGGGAIVGKALGLVKPALSPIKGAIARRVGNSAVTPHDIAKLEQYGFRPEVGMLGNPEAAAYSQSMRGKPTTGSIFGEVDAHNLANATKMSDGIAAKLGPDMIPYDIGQLVKRDAIAFRTQWKDVSDDLWKKVGDFVPDGGSIPAKNIVAEAQKVLFIAKQSPYAGNAMAPAVREAKLILESVDGNGNISKGALDSIKKAARGSYKKLAHEADDIDRLRMTFERAADRDLGAAAEEAGGEAAKQARAAAKDWYKRGMGDKKLGEVGLLDEAAEIIKNPEPEKIYRQIVGGGKPAAERMMRVMNLLSSDTQAALRARAYREMAMPTPGAANADGGGFSFSTFLTRYARMQQEAPGMSDILFGPARKDLDKLLDSAEFFKSLAGYANKSNTAVNAAWDNLWKPIVDWTGKAAIGGGVAGMSLSSAVLGAAGGGSAVAGQLAVYRRVARLMTDPEFVKWLAGSTTKVASGATTGKEALGRLAAIAIQRASTSKDKEMTNDFVWYLTQTGNDVTKVTDQNGKVKKVEVK